MAPLTTFAVFFSVLLVSAAPAPGILLTDPSQLASSYDFIVVGGGTSGLTTGVRLSENPAHRVLIIESGPHLTGEQEFTDVLALREPVQVASPERSTAHMWANHTTGPIESLANRTIGLHMAKIVGGGSALNGKLWMRGSRGDYDDWARYLGDSRWGWDSVLPYFKKSETYHPPPEELRVKGPVTWDMKYRGTKGPISATNPGFFYDSTKTLIEGEKEAGIRQIREQGSGDPLGAFWHPISAEKGTYERSYVKSGYLDPLLEDPKRKRNNLHVLPDTTVTKLLFSGKTIIGVEFVSSAKPDGVKKTVRTKKEVIIASGSIKTVQLLQISGIGPKKLLKSLDIPVISDLPVGENFQDHGFLTLNIRLTLPEGPEKWRSENNFTFLQEQYQLFLSSRKGIYTSTNNGRMSLLPLPFFLPNAKSLLKQLSKEPHTKYLPEGSSREFSKSYKKQIALHYESFAKSRAAALELTANHRQLLPIRPASRGIVFAKSKSIFAAPAINHRSLTHPLDLAIMIGGIRWVRKFMQLDAVKEWNATEIAPGPDRQTDEELEEYIRANMNSGTAHMCCTAPMGTVLDSRMRVRGVKGLRVVDTASWPILPGAHTTWCTAVMVAEKAADIIKADYRE